MTSELLSSCRLQVDGWVYIRTYWAASWAVHKVGHELDFTIDRGQREQLVRVEYQRLTCGAASIHQLLENKWPAIPSSLSACSYLTEVWKVQLITQTFSFFVFLLVLDNISAHSQHHCKHCIISHYCQSCSALVFPVAVLLWGKAFFLLPSTDLWGLTAFQQCQIIMAHQVNCWYLMATL